MLKWLSNARPKSRTDLVTDDPLATIKASPQNDRSDLIYSVSRINPIFEEEKKKKRGLSNLLKQSSSGYNSRNSSDLVSSSHEYENSLQKEALTILEQNTSFVKSIFVAVRGKKESSTLNPIPEGAIDYTIPRPVWPRNENKYKKQVSSKKEERDEWYSENEKSDNLGINFSFRTKLDFEENSNSTKDILKDIAHTINLALEQKHQISPEDLLRTLSHAINKNRDAFASESSIARLSRHVGQTEAVATISRAFSHTSSFSEPYLSNRPLSDAEAGRLQLLKRLGKLSLYEPIYEKHSRGSSTSSEETSSGFSEFSPTPTTSSESPSSRRSPENTTNKVPLFTHEHLSTVSNGLRNAVLYGSGMQCRDGQNEYERLNFRDSKSSDDEVKEDSVKEISSSSWEAATGSKFEAEYNVPHNMIIPGYNGPDFTLDTHQAEKLMHRIKETKRQRFWCRLTTCLFGLLFLLLSVMAVSMFITRGQRMFGSL